MRLSDFTPVQGSSLIAGETIAYKDLLYIDGYDGNSRKVAVTNFAAIGNVDYGTAITDANSGQIVAHTIVSSVQTIAHSRQAIVKNSNGETFTLSGNASVSKFSPDGALMTQVDMALSGCSNHHILLLDNGNIACLIYASPSIRFYIYDNNLNLIKDSTSIASSNNLYFSAISLSGGGFAIIYQDSSNQLISKMASYDNAGIAVLSPATIWTRAGTAGNQYHKLVQLSSGNLAIAISSLNTVSSIGLYYGVFSPAGSVISAFSLLDSTSVGIFPEIVSKTGFFAVSRPNGTNQKAYVFNNSGAQQGSEISFATTAGNASNKTKLLSDGTDFWLIWHRNSDSQCIFTKIISSGSADKSVSITGSPSQFNFYMDAFYENGLVCIVALQSGSGKPLMLVASTKTGALLSASSTLFGIAPSSSGSYPRVIAGGDRSFIAMFDYATTAATIIFAGKYMKTAVIGLAQNGVAASNAVRITSGVGAYDINTIGGTAVSFDHTTNKIVGNKGSMAVSSVSLRGMGV